MHIFTLIMILAMITITSTAGAIYLKPSCHCNRVKTVFFTITFLAMIGEIILIAIIIANGSINIHLT